MRRAKPVFIILICILFVTAVPLTADMHSDYKVILDTLLDNLNFLRDGLRPEMDDHELISHLEEFMARMGQLDDMAVALQEEYPEVAGMGEEEMTPDELALKEEIISFYVNLNPILEQLAVRAESNPAIAEYMNQIMGF